MLQSTFAVEKMPTSNLNLSRNSLIKEQRLLELITQKKKIKNRILDKGRKFGNIIDIKNNDKAKFNKGYERWAIKHNMKAAVGTMIIIYEKDFGSMKELEKVIDRNFFEKNELK